MTEFATFTCSDCEHRFSAPIMPWDDADADELPAECPECGEFRDCAIEDKR